LRKLFGEPAHPTRLAFVMVESDAVHKFGCGSVTQDRARVIESGRIALRLDIVIVVIAPDFGFQSLPPERRAEMVANEIPSITRSRSLGGRRNKFEQVECSSDEPRPSIV